MLAPQRGRTVTVGAAGALCALVLWTGSAAALPCGDLDGDGSRAAADAALARQQLADPVAAALTPEQAARCIVNPATDRCDVGQVAVLRRHLADPNGFPLPALCDEGDWDGDGVRNDQDACPRTPDGAPVLDAGCSALGLVESPNDWLGPVLATLAEYRDPIAAHVDGADTALELDSARDALLQAAASLGQADPCAAETELGTSTAALGSAVTALDDWIDADIAVAPAPTEGDDGWEAESFRDQLYVTGRYLDEARLALEARAAVVSALCSTASAVVVTEVVDSIDDELGRIHLRDGQLFTIADGAESSGSIAPGQSATLTGSLLGSSLGAANLLDAADPTGSASGQMSCLRLRFAPVQRSKPYRLRDAELHPPDAYEASGSYVMEHGMGVAAERVCADAPGQRHYLQVRVSYTHRLGYPQFFDTYAPDLDDRDEPVVLPIGLDPNQPVTLHVRSIVHACSLVPGPGGGLVLSCSSPEELDAASYTVDLAERGGHCGLIYQGSKFDLDETVSWDWQTTEVVAINTPGGTVPLPGATLFAEGRDLHPIDGVMVPYPGVLRPFLNEPFPVENSDAFPVFPVDGLPVFHARLVHGVDTASVLRWPHLRGTNNGERWWLSCDVPQIVRDVVDFCPSEPHAYYRLPFASGSPAWQVAQGNLSDPGCMGSGCLSHANGYALDMGRGVCGDEIRAMRSGRVWWEFSNRTCQSVAIDPNDPGAPLDCAGLLEPPVCGSLCCSVSTTCTGLPTSPCKGNWVRIRHQDGTLSTYLHMMPGGVAVSQGQLVRRGELVGQMGTTGRSQGVHLHLSTEDFLPTTVTSLKGSGHLGLYEGIADGIPKQCWEPLQGQSLLSTNPAQP